MAYVLKNFSYGELASSITDLSVQMTLAGGYSLPEVGIFVVVVWDMDTYPNPADDPSTEIMLAEYSGLGAIFNITRAQEDTIATAHAAGSQAALHMTAGLLSSDRFVIGSLSVDEAAKADTKTLLVSGSDLVYGGHDDLFGFVSDEHVAHGSISVLAGTGLSGGGTIDGNITINNNDSGSGAVSTHEGTYSHTNYNTAYSHSQLVSGNPHSVTPTELGLVIGTNTQAWDADLDAIAAISSADGNFIVGSAAGWVAESGATARTSIGLGTTDTPQFTRLGVGAAADATISLDVVGTSRFGDSATNFAGIGANGHIVLNGTARVWEDLQFPVNSGKQPSSANPTWAALTTNTGSWGFAVDNYVDLDSNEVSHGWKEGTTAKFHLHLSIPVLQNAGANRFAKFSVFVAYVNYLGIWAESTLTEEVTIPNNSAALQTFYLSMGDRTLAGMVLGTQMKCRVKRITATGGTEYSSNVFIHQVGCHLEMNTIGSSAELTK